MYTHMSHLQLSDPSKDWIAHVSHVPTGRHRHEHAWAPLDICFYYHLALRYNVKRRLVKRAPATEAQFQSLMEDLELSSISGSGSSDSEGESDGSDDDDDGEGVRGHRRRAMMLSLPEEEEREEDAAGAGSSDRGAAALSHALQIPQFVFQAAGRKT